MRRCLNAQSVSTYAAIAVMALCCNPSQAQFFRGGAVGGVSIDAHGVLTAPEVGQNEQMMQAWQKGLKPAPADLQQYTDMRYVSLRRLEEQVAKSRAAGEQLPEGVACMAGLLRVEYVFVYPEQGDVVLAGPAEGWKVDRLGNVVGATSNRPVLMLEDLMVALRSNKVSGGPVISCSIDPTEEGLRRAQQVASRFTSATTSAAAGRRMEEALGPQVITVTGVPATSHFARAIVAADFRMKRLAMNFEPAPIDGMPSYLHLAGKNTDAFPRWWLAANYEPLLQDPQGLAWQLRGQGVKCMTETDFVDAQGRRTHSGKASPNAQKWADLLTERFEDLANEDSAFGQLRNVMDLSVVAALLHKEGLIEHVGLELPEMMTGYELEEFPAPREVASQASFLNKRGKRIVTASGGVQLTPWHVAENLQETTELAPAREQAIAKAGAAWWWQ
ncbi:hypothetical protein Pla123a_47060 [Posidoniimonas polymericola]|uniref:DUF1598 domain-containing protein n=1 Tax=Posidoniimonas polymericola TaxID=2528002 RepID=A0A5C5XXI4_9BACT|nr:DUF1598 domain-containing protein [Posidoniimonas polymericola]TWT66312.1 hypothetical protein Pla123a_47060 [Posidoniimonas polymericola]